MHPTTLKSYDKFGVVQAGLGATNRFRYCVHLHRNPRESESVRWGGPYMTYIGMFFFNMQDLLLKPSYSARFDQITVGGHTPAHGGPRAVWIIAVASWVLLNVFAIDLQCSQSSQDALPCHVRCVSESIGSRWATMHDFLRSVGGLLYIWLYDLMPRFALDAMYVSKSIRAC